MGGRRPYPYRVAHERLSITDTMFLALEGPDTPQNIGFLAIFEGAPLVGPDGRFRIDHVVDFVRGTVHGFARFRHRILPVPFGLGRPVWIDHAEFDVANHVRAETLVRALYAVD